MRNCSHLMPYFYEMYLLQRFQHLLGAACRYFNIIFIICRRHFIFIILVDLISKIGIFLHHFCILANHGDHIVWIFIIFLHEIYVLVDKFFVGIQESLQIGIYAVG